MIYFSLTNVGFRKELSDLRLQNIVVAQLVYLWTSMLYPQKDNVIGDPPLPITRLPSGTLAPMQLTAIVIGH